MRAGFSSRRRLALFVGPAVVAALAFAAYAAANIALTQISSDPFTNSTSQHKTQVEPDSYSAGSTIVATMQSGRFFDGGASDIGFATSTNGGTSWSHGFLPGTTPFSTPPGPYDRVSDPSVAYDAKHDVWMISSLGLKQAGGINGVAVLVNRSTNGGLSWSNPVTVAGIPLGGTSLDKNWTVCDDTPTSKFYGSCYTEWDDNGAGNRLHVAYSRDGGATWTQSSTPAVSVIGAQPVVKPNGVVIMPTDNGSATALISLRSTNGGVSWSNPVTIATISDHFVAGGLRTRPLPTAEIDGAGKVYVAWQDCRFRTNCSSNDIVYAKSTTGLTWSTVRRVPIDGKLSTVDHFIPGLAVDKSTSGTTAHLGLAYYYYPNASCSFATCQLKAGFISSLNSGSTWSAPTQVAGPMMLKWLPATSQGRMVGDYTSASFVNGSTFPIFAVANAPTVGTDCQVATPNCDQATYTSASGLAASGPFRSATSEQPVANAASDHPAPAAPVTQR